MTLAGSFLMTPVFTPAVNDQFLFVNNHGQDPVIGTFAGLAEGSTFTINGTTLRISYRGGSGNDVVLTVIPNTIPRFPNRSITATTTEGGVVTIAGDISEPDPGDIFVLEIDWKDGTPLDVYTFASGIPQATVTHRYADNPSAPDDVYLVDVLWHDQHGAFNAAQMPVAVANVAPQLAPISNVRLDVNQLLVITASFSDPGADSWQARVDYGDGSGFISVPIRDHQVSLVRSFADPGYYSAVVEVSDDEGAVSRMPFEITYWPLGTAQPGDANRDLRFESSDLVALFLAGKYETGAFATWEEGDWNGDGQFNSSDIRLAFMSGNYEQGPYPSNSMALLRANNTVVLFESEDDSLLASSASTNATDAAVDAIFAELEPQLTTRRAFVA